MYRASRYLNLLLVVYHLRNHLVVESLLLVVVELEPQAEILLEEEPLVVAHPEEAHLAEFLPVAVAVLLAEVDLELV